MFIGFGNEVAWAIGCPFPFQFIDYGAFMVLEIGVLGAVRCTLHKHTIQF
jgi:hypothetical protein